MRLQIEKFRRVCKLMFFQITGCSHRSLFPPAQCHTVHRYPLPPHPSRPRHQHCSPHFVDESRHQQHQ